ncbi:hypothetical protein B9Z55_015773 [Caenorhabditis nigoni]|uniref:Uncharacterized protein n=1 Tax=Caenorhabditis nigoni TaxID=1611254 RepID=A0A2G5UBP0_9PELO|nr:hypothetical protein B9Z55_015773 [Caenorhabditis nigoni]
MSVPHGLNEQLSFWDTFGVQNLGKKESRDGTTSRDGQPHSTLTTNDGLGHAVWLRPHAKLFWLVGTNEQPQEDATDTSDAFRKHSTG